MVILHQEESASELVKHVQHFHLLDQGVEQPPKRHQQEMRTYGLGSQILADLGVGKMRVLSNPVKAPGLSGFGLEIVEYIGPSAADSGLRAVRKESAGGKR